MLNQKSVLETFFKNKPELEISSKQKPELEVSSNQKPVFGTFSKPKSVLETFSKNKSEPEVFSKQKSDFRTFLKQKPISEILSEKKPIFETFSKPKPASEVFFENNPELETFSNQKSELEVSPDQKPASEVFLEKKSVFETLFEVNVNDRTEKKNGLSYLSWPFAWAEVKKKFPEANYTVYENSSGFFYHTDGKTCWVKTGVTINGLEHIEYLPVMDFRNRSISLENVTSFDVNKAIQRSLTKTLARHGLGLYVYAGEDLPEVEKISPLKAANLRQIIENLDDKELYSKILRKYQINSLKELTVKQYLDLVNRIDNFSEA